MYKNRFSRLLFRDVCGHAMCITSDVSDDKTNMAEIVKRFQLNEPLPCTTEDKTYEYEDNVRTDDNGKVVVDSKGNIINDDVLTNEILDLIPITPNLDYIDSRIDSDYLNQTYSEATDRARAFVRAKQIEQDNIARVKESALIDNLMQQGKVVSSSKVEVNKTVENSTD